MESVVGIVKKFDELGRIVIPKQFRHSLGQEVEVFKLKNGNILLKKIKGE